MIPKCATWSCVLALFLLSGCADKDVDRFEGGMDRSVQENSGQIDHAVDFVDAGFTRNYNDKIKSLESWRNNMAKKRDESAPHGLMFFQEDAALPAAAKTNAKAPAAPITPPKEIRSDILTDRSLQQHSLRLLWRLAVDPAGVKYADLNDNRLYIVSNQNRLYSIDAKTGLTQWAYDLGSLPDGPPGFSIDYVVISANNTIRVIDKQLGREKWKFTTNVQPSTRPFCTTTAFYYGCWTGDVCGFGFGDAFPRWQFTVAGDVFAAPCVIGQNIYAVNQNGLFKRYNMPRQATGTPIDFKARPVGDIVTSKEMVFVATENYEVHSVQTADGSRGWSFTTSGRITDGPWISADAETLYFRAENNGLFAISSSTGKEIWRLPDARRIVGSASKGFFVLNDDHTLSRVDPKTGTRLWTEPIAPFTDVITQLQSDNLFLISADGQVYALAPKK